MSKLKKRRSVQRITCCSWSCYPYFTQFNNSQHSSLSSNFGGLDEDQSIQYTTDSCTDLTFSVFSPHPTERLILYADGTCKDTQLSQSQIGIKFLPCTCPIGFQPDNIEVTKCSCNCDFKLHKFITECHHINRTLIRLGNFWIMYVSTTDDSSDYNYLVYPHCPLNYCIHQPQRCTLT